jgi:DNA-binding response OmpR family regulator
VTDHGPGVPEDFRDQIFDKFTQADSSDTRQKGGTDLGLNISRAIIEKHGGTLDYHSEAGAGATFYFDLPVFKSIQAAGREAAAAPDSRPRDSQDAGSRILICEDDPDIARVISKILQQDGYVTDIACDAYEAKKLLGESHFDAMTVDIMLPGQDGISLIRDLWAAEETKDLATVVVSAKAEQAAQDFAATTMGIVDWLGKPLNEERLLGAVRKAVRGRPGGKPSILYVEDDTDLSGFITALLAGVADVVPVYTLETAQELLRHGTFDLAIIDIVLPDGSGLDLLPLLKNHGKPSTPVILFSGEEVGRDTALKVEAALVKSRTTDGELLATIKSLIDAKSGP